jgi:hypothetical protein
MPIVIPRIQNILKPSSLRVGALFKTPLIKYSHFLTEILNQISHSGLILPSQLILKKIDFLDQARERTFFVEAL